MNELAWLSVEAALRRPVEMSFTTQAETSTVCLPWLADQSKLVASARFDDIGVNTRESLVNVASSRPKWLTRSPLDPAWIVSSLMVPTGLRAINFASNNPSSISLLRLPV
jgi:hypothetical protein